MIASETEHVTFNNLHYDRYKCLALIKRKLALVKQGLQNKENVFSDNYLGIETRFRFVETFI